MPRGDRTGPLGQGPMTGRRMGYCAGYNTPGFANPLNRGGFGRGYWGGGRGWGWSRGYYGGGPGWGWGPRWGWANVQPPTPEQELTNLETYASQLHEQLSLIQKRIDELKNKED